MQMDMRTHLLVPGVEHGQEAKPCSESMRVGGNGEQGLGNRSKKDVVEDSRVLQCELGKLVRQRERDMGIGDGK